MPRDPPTNLWGPADGPSGRDFGIHGRFDDRSTSRTYRVWASDNHALLGGLMAAAGLTVAALRCR